MTAGWMRAIFGLLVAGVVFALPSAASAVPQSCNPDCPDPGPGQVTQTKTVTLTVSKGGGTVTGPGISCGSDSETSVQLSRDCDGGVCQAWTTATLSLTGIYPIFGYVGHWTGCDAPTTGSSCTVTLTSAGDKIVSVAWQDAAPPSVTFDPPAKVGGTTTSLSASGSDNSGSIAHYAWWVDDNQQGATGSLLSLSGISQGTHTIKVQAVDAAGNGSTQVSHDVTIDRQVNLALGALPTIT